jgi:hypothetical protein
VDGRKVLATYHYINGMWYDNDRTLVGDDLQVPYFVYTLLYTFPIGLQLRLSMASAL